MITSASMTTIVDPSKSWMPGAYANGLVRFYIELVAGKGAGQRRLIVGNTSTDIMVDRPWDVVPNDTTVYTIRPESIFALDRARIETTWRRLAPPSYRGLLEALPATGLSAPANRFWWDPGAAKYGFGTKGHVRPKAVQRAMHQFNDNQAAELAALTLVATADTIPPGQWDAAMRTAIQDSQVINAAVGRGGLTAIKQTDVQKLLPAVIYNLGRFDRFSDQVSANAKLFRTTGGKAAPTLKPEAAAVRAKAYAKTAINAYDGARRDSAAEANYTMEMNLLGDADHCQARPDSTRSDCPSLERMGWVPMGTLPRIGERICLWNCKCHIDFK